jgi:methionine-rich copper-binding protein CopC
MRTPSDVCEKFVIRTPSRAPSRGTVLRPVMLMLIVASIVLTGLVLVSTPASAANPCVAPVQNAVACENTRVGTTDWEVSPDASIEGFTSDISTNVGGRVDFKVRTDSRSYTVDIYRLGWYGGAGGRLMTSLTPTAALPQTQPECAREAATGLVDCGNWAVSASWTVPADAVSGVYVANLLRKDTGAANQITFVVRNDASRSDMVVQTSDTTWAAYNDWGGAGLYYGNGPGGSGRAYKVSYNRPLNQSVSTARLMYAEYPMIRFLESNGYDISYQAGVDTDRLGNLLPNHRVFVSVGHDEYWSGAQRANVEAARNAGVNLAFFSGNEMWWKVRWESSIAGPAAAHRTLVSYKESLDGARTDPTGQWTGTWRDPRFATGVSPENALIGQQFKVNGEYGRRHDAIAVPAELAKARIWRNTAVAKQTSGSYAFPEGTLGYEWDSDYDNGFRPAGLAKLSDTTVQAQEPDILQDDYGVKYAPGSATHSLTLYRAGSGALVFAAGTVQWSWGLDDEHGADGAPRAIANTPMRQATVNLLADMGVQPATRASDLVAATASADTTAPTVAITSAADQKVTVGTPFTVRGTAADTGGIVSGVEISVDGGTTWHPASGRSSWSYTFTPSSTGPLNVRVRAVDDSVRLSSPVGYDSTVGQRACPCTIWPASAAPASAAVTDPTALELGTRFQSTVGGYVAGVRFYKGAGVTGTHTGSLWSATGERLATGTFTGETASGWQTLTFPQAVPIAAGTSYVVSYWSPTGQYVADSDYFARPVQNEPLLAPQSAAGAPNGVYRSGSAGFPSDTWQATNYWVDVVFQTEAPTDTRRPSATAASPVPGSSSVARDAAASVVFDEPVQPASIVLTMTGAAGSAVAGTVSYDPGTRTATFRPTEQLAAGTKFTVSLTASRDQAGNTQAAPVTWSFTTMRAPATPGVCPCSVWDDTAVPGVVTAEDPGAIELGMRFRAASDGTVTGARFYKGPRNTGTHTGTLWSADGSKLATATFSEETSSGWQQVAFSQPVTVTAGTTYVVSYHSDAGFYSLTAGGLAATVTSGPLTALADGDGGPNGVYAYGASAFPVGAGSANYWVDVLFQPAADTTGPAVSGTSPGAGATSVPTSGPLTATFTEPVTATSTVFSLRTGTTTVSGTTSYDASSRTATFTPSAALRSGTTYTVTVSGAADPAGNRMAAPVEWSFTTAGAGACPCTVFAGRVPGTPAADDADAVEVGVKIRTDVDGFITGVRFYKGPGNTGTHTGNLWSAAGKRLATGTFTNETASGWQQLAFATPVAVTAGTTYVASYHAPAGRYAADGGFFTGAGTDNAPLHALASGVDGANGVYAYGATSGFPSKSWQATNYWVDAVFATAAPVDTTAPTVTATAPGQGFSGIATTTPIEFDLDEAVATGSAVVRVTAGGAAVPGSVTLPDARTVRFIPTAPLPAGTSVTAVLSEVRDLAGNGIAAPYTLGFGTAATDSAQCPCTLFGPTAQPAVASADDTDSVELGVRFSSSVAGYVTGVRFYKGTGNTGGHTGSLWAAGGTRLATATFSGESASGWQQVLFSAPVAIAPGQEYVASYHASSGGYAADSGYFTGSGVDRGPLHAPASDVTRGNGVYAYGATARFPAGTHQGTNYWVDVVFTTATPPVSPPVDTTAPTVLATGPAAAAQAVAATTPVTATFSEPVTAGSLQLTVTGPAGAVPATVSLDATGTTATAWPTAALAGGTTYTAVARGTDAAGNAMSAPHTWTFTTADPTAPTVTAVTPAGGSTGVATAVVPTVTFSEPVRFPSVQAVLKAGSETIAATVAASGDRAVTVSPAAALTSGTAYTVTVSGATDLAGNVLVAPYTWSFTTAGTAPPACPCSLFSSTDSPPLAAVSTKTATERGMKFRSTTAGQVTAIRFYKAFGGTGTHTGSLWTTTGQRLATVTFTNETMSGWQTATLATPVTIAANTVYVVSYTAPAGRWAQTANYFTSQKTTGRLQGLANSQSANGVSGAAGKFPATGASAANFWVDVVLTTTTPAAAAASPAAGPTASVQGMAPGEPAGTAAAGTSAPATAATTAPSCPCSFFGPADAPVDRQVTDEKAAEVGLRFRATAAGWITAVRWYAPGRTDAERVGSLWSDGQRLATVRLPAATGPGWQEAVLDQPLAVSTGVEYVVSYTVPTGAEHVATVVPAGARTAGPLEVSGMQGAAVTGEPGTFPAGAASGTDFWADVVVVTTPPQGAGRDTAVPTVTATAPHDSASADARPAVTFSEPVTGVGMELTGPDGRTVPATFTYDPATLTARLTPERALRRGQVFRVTVRGATDGAGNALTPPSWEFTVAG